MAFRFWRRINFLPGVTLNLSKSSGSLSFGPRGAKYTISPRGNRATAGIPGTGLFYTYRGASGTGRKNSRRRGKAQSDPQPDHVAPGDPLDFGFFRRLVMAPHERGIIDAVRALNEGDIEAAIDAARTYPQVADTSWLSGVMQIKLGNHDAAHRHLKDALENALDLDAVLGKYGITIDASVPIGDFVTAHLQPDIRSTRLALFEVSRLSGREKEAVSHIEVLVNDDAPDPVVLACYAESVIDRGDRDTMRDLVERTAGIENETPVDTAILLLRGRALARLGLRDAAIDELTKAYRRRKDRPEELRLQIRYDRALLLREKGRAARARRELEAIYSADPSFEDVARQLGLEP